jgi:uncharacterized protein (DUF433 family)
MERGLAERTLGVNPQVSVEDVVNMLMQGVTPDELVQQGVPVELIEQAIAMMEAQAMQQEAGMPQGGLASRMM